MWNEFPAADQVNANRLERDMALPLPDLTYVMYFTPRTGSSWLTDVAKQSGVLGYPREVFNPHLLKRRTTAANATSMDAYIGVFPRREAIGGVAGFQITHHQLKAVFGDEDAFMRRFAGAPCFWLIRQDIVAQGMSLYKMQQTQIAHAWQDKGGDIAARETQFTYDAEKIAHWITHIRRAEEGTEAMIERFGLTPFRMSYERNTQLRPRKLINVMAQHLGLPRVGPMKIQTKHRKIGTDTNQEFADRFRAENADFVARLDEVRQPMIDKLNVIRTKAGAQDRPD